MSKIRYGIRRVVLLNSGNYSRGEFPLDRPVSISGENNKGKSTFINALQFPFLCDLRNMDFIKGNGETLEYYFPNTNSYILSEARTEFGTFVIGAVGLGVSMGNNYVLFVYQKELKIEEDFFVLQNSGREVQVRTLEELSSHLAAQNVWLEKLPPQKMLKVLAGIDSFQKTRIGVFRLVESNFLPMFIEVFKNLLQMKEFNMEKMKYILLNALMPNWKKTTNQVLRSYDEYFLEIQAEQNKIDTANRVYPKAFDVNGKIMAWEQLYSFLKPAHSFITNQFGAQRKAREEEIQALQGEFANIDTDLTAKETERKTVDEQKTEAAIEKRDLDKWFEMLKAEKEKFEHVSEGSMFSKEALATERDRLRQQAESIRFSLSQSKGRSVQHIESQIKEKARSIKEKERLLNSLKANLVYELKDQLAPGEIQNLLKLLSENLLLKTKINDGKVLSLENPQGMVAQTRKILSFCKDGFYRDGTVAINLQEIEDLDIETYLNEENIKASIVQLREELEGQERTLQAAKGREKKEDQLKRVEGRVNGIEETLRRHEEYCRHLEDEPQKQEAVQKAMADIAQFDIQLAIIEKDKMALVERKAKGQGIIADKQTFISRLEKMVQMVRPVAEIVGGSAEPTDELISEIEAMDYGELIQDYIQKKEKAEHLEALIRNGYDVIEEMGGLRGEFAHGDTIPERIRSIIENTDAECVKNLEASLERIRNAHVQLIRGTLKALTRKYDEFIEKIQVFNRGINRNKISNLKKIEFSLSENTKALQRIRGLMEAEPGSLFDDNSSEKFKELMKSLDDGETINLSNLFSLNISVELQDGETTVFSGGSQIESNGTDLTVKIILNVMILKRILRQRPDQVLNIPIYIDEASQIDRKNQRTLIRECESTGFVPVFASVEPQDTVHYLIRLEPVKHRILVTPQDWYTIERLEREEEDDLEKVLSEVLD